MERSELTPRELEVVRLLSQGCTYGRIADRLGISEGTVTSHIKNLYRKLDVHTAAAAVCRAMQLDPGAAPLENLMSSVSHR